MSGRGRMRWFELVLDGRSGVGLGERPVTSTLLLLCIVNDLILLLLATADLIRMLRWLGYRRVTSVGKLK